MKIGVCVGHQAQKTDEAFAKMVKNGFSCCQFISWNPSLWTAEERDHILRYHDHGLLVWLDWAGRMEFL